MTGFGGGRGGQESLNLVNGSEGFKTKVGVIRTYGVGGSSGTCYKNKNLRDVTNISFAVSQYKTYRLWR